MKKVLITITIMELAAAAFAQGTILFSNNNIPAADGNGTYRAGIFLWTGQGAGAGWTAGLFVASNLNTPLATTTFRTNNNFEVFADNTQEVAIPGALPGSTANLVVRAWETAAGSYAASWGRGEQAFTSRALGGPNPVPGEPAFPTPGMTGFTGFLVPEPSTLALAAMGVGVLVFRRRK